MANVLPLVVLPWTAKFPPFTMEDSANKPAFDVHADSEPDSNPSLKTGAGLAVGVLVAVGVNVAVSVGVYVAVGVNVTVGVDDGIGVACTLKTNWGALTPSFEE